jgi:predicted extracellular nuclease
MQEVENIDILQQLATQIAGDGGPTYSAHLVEGNDVGGIDVGYLVNTARVANIEVTQLQGAETWDDPENGPGTILHDRPPLLLAADFTGNGRPFRFHVINNHTRSRGGVDVSNPDGERTRAKRYTQGVSIANLVQDLQTGKSTAGVPLLVVGDHNAYQFTDAYTDVVGLVAGTYDNAANTCAPANAVTDCKLPGGSNIVTPALVNAVDLLDINEQYSYNFTESFGAVQGSSGREIATNQVLDHALFNSVAAPFVTGMAFGRANVDASDQRFRTCNFRFDNQLCPQGPGTWVPTGSSDHDGLVIFLAPPRPEDIFANGFEP